MTARQEASNYDENCHFTQATTLNSFTDQSTRLVYVFVFQTNDVIPVPHRTSPQNVK